MQDKHCKKRVCTCPKNRCVCKGLFSPTVKELPDKLTTGTCIIITGLVALDCSRFVVNLSCGRKLESDIALHINPCLTLRYVVRNCRIGGQWGEEEMTSMQKFDIERNKEFVMEIMLAEREFLVSINGKHFCGFVYRIPLNYVKVITVNGHVSIHDIEYKMVEIYPMPSSQTAPLELSLGGLIERPVDTSSPMRTPFMASLPQGFPLECELEINGYIKFISKTFFINLQDGHHLWPHPDVHLHIKSISTTEFDEQTFFFNTRNDGVWGEQERTNATRFTPASYFILVIQRLEDHFSIWVDNQLVKEFKLRGKVDKINSVYIQGDVYINSLCLRQIR